MNTYSDPLAAYRHDLSASGIPFTENEPMAQHTTFRIGGRVALFVMPRNRSELIKALDSFRPYSGSVSLFVVGRGSNMLFPDCDMPAVVVCTCGVTSVDISTGEAPGDACGIPTGKRAIRVKADCGISVTKLASLAARQNPACGGLVFAYGIPGTLGGAVTMNAGAYGGDISQILVRSDYYDTETGEVHTLEFADHAFAYRTSSYQSHPNRIILSAELVLPESDTSNALEQMEANMQSRKARQPLDKPNAGSFFKRPALPPDAQPLYVGKMIEDLGMKGLSVGGAQVSEKHAGFFVNTGNATYDDVICLMNTVCDRVREAYGVSLEPEVRIVRAFRQEKEFSMPNTTRNSLPFSETVRRELFGIPVKSTCCKRALMLGLLSCGIPQTENGQITACTVNLPYADAQNCPEPECDTDAFFYRFLGKDISVTNLTKGAHKYKQVTVRTSFAVNALNDFMRYDPTALPSGSQNAAPVPTGNTGGTGSVPFLKCDNCLSCYLRGLFLGCGILSDPKNHARLELRPQDSALCHRAFSLFQSFGIDGRYYPPSRIVIGKASAVSEYLGRIGASGSLFSFLNDGIIHELAGLENRYANCETVNIKRQVMAASRQVQSIRLVKSSALFASLPQDLRETATLRLENPELSLSELASLHNPPITKSGLNHRLQKLTELASTLADDD